MRVFPIALLAAAALCGQNPVVVENGWVRVVKAGNIPGQLSRPHVHLMNRVMIHLDKGTLRIDNKETGVVRNIPFRAGEVRWDPRVGLHTSENTGGTAIRIVELELNDAPPRKGKAVAKLPAPPDGYRAELENEQVRILRTSLDGGAKAAYFLTPVVAVRLTDGETVFRMPAQAPVTNESGSAAEWIFVEIK
jgi:hypothetical protein